MILSCFRSTEATVRTGELSKNGIWWHIVKHRTRTSSLSIWYPCHLKTLICILLVKVCLLLDFQLDPFWCILLWVDSFHLDSFPWLIPNFLEGWLILRIVFMVGNCAARYRPGEELSKSSCLPTVCSHLQYVVQQMVTVKMYCMFCKLWFLLSHTRFYLNGVKLITKRLRLQNLLNIMNVNEYILLNKYCLKCVFSWLFLVIVIMKCYPPLYRRFKFPDGFEEESSVSERLQLSLGDLDDDKELWLIKVPNNVSTNPLSNVY